MIVGISREWYRSARVYQPINVQQIRAAFKKSIWPRYLVHVVQGGGAEVTRWGRRSGPAARLGGVLT